MNETTMVTTNEASVVRVRKLFAPTVGDRKTLDELAHTIAYEAACVTIDANTPHEKEGEWFDVTECDEFAQEDVAQAVRYLDMRGLLCRDPVMYPRCVSILNESEAPR